MTHPAQDGATPFPDLSALKALRESLRDYSGELLDGGQRPDLYILDIRKAVAALDAIIAHTEAQDARIREMEGALHLLCDTHTHEDSQVGFTVDMMPAIWGRNQLDYINAWKKVREHLHLPTKPAALATQERT